MIPMAKWRAIKRLGKSGYVDLEAVAAAIPHDTRHGYTQLFFAGGHKLTVEGNPKDFVPDDGF
jgi:hypothetical protein